MHKFNIFSYWVLLVPTVEKYIYQIVLNIANYI